MRRNTIPNAISASRGITALAMLFCTTFSLTFWILYCWGGISDMIDGPIARRLKAESQFGAVTDSIADLLFIISSFIMILPTITLPTWIWIWISSIAFVKVTGIILRSSFQHTMSIPHSTSNKLTGLLLFLMPFLLDVVGAYIPAIVICMAASISIIEDFKYSR